MKKFEYILILDDIVINSAGILEAADQEAAEKEIENNILPNCIANRYTIKEI